MVRSRRWTLGAACAAGVLGATASLGPFLAVFVIAREVLGGAPSMDRVWQAALLGLAATLIKFALGWMSHSLAHAAAFGIQYDLRLRIARKLGRVPLGFFDRRGAGSLHKAMMDDVDGVEAFIAHRLPDAAAALFVPIAAFALMAFVDWRMALASLVAVPFAIGFQVAMLTSDDNRAAYDRYHRANEATKEAVLEYLRGIHVVKTFGLEARSFGELESAVDEMTAYVEDYARRSAPPYIVAMKLFAGGTNALFMLPIGLWLHQAGTLSTPALLFFLLVGTQVLSPFLRVANVLGQLQLLLRGVANVRAVLEAPTLADRESVTDAAVAGGTLRLEDVRFSYADAGAGPRPWALDGLSLEARAGERTAIVGPSGSGKSTVLRLLARFWDPDSGSVRLEHEDLRDAPLDAHLARISVVFQDVFLFRGTVADNLRIAQPGATDEELVAACRQAQLHDVIARLPESYDTLLGERGARLSGGERQRLSVARALLKDAPILLLDEATAFADAASERALHAALGAATRGRTVVVVAHRLETIRDADRIVVLDAGRALDVGDHATLIERCALYRRLWESYTAADAWTLGTVSEPGGTPCAP
ncbi:MAG: ABC transporter ATP-binding protein [Myxococcota bacterium]